MILSCNFEELGALSQGARAVLGEGPGEGDPVVDPVVAPVMAPPKGQERVWSLTPKTYESSTNTATIGCAVTYCPIYVSEFPDRN